MKTLKPLLLTLSILFASTIVRAQDSSPGDNNKADTAKVYTAVEHEPEFKGGVQAFYAYLTHTIHYPAKAREHNIQGKVFISFIVEKDGSLSDIKIVRSVSEDLDAEALRVIKGSPHWNPGLQNGKPVRVAYTMPLSFALASK
jgi:protein TonB